MTITKVISGGQTGADRGGLTAAKKAGIATGGMMPKGFIAHDGNHPEFAEEYNITEHSSPTYPPRTFANAANSDGTVRFAVDFETAGEKCTLKAIDAAKKPHFDVHILGDTTPTALAKWIVEEKIAVLNVAGNSEKRSAGIHEFTEAFLLQTFDILKQYASVLNAQFTPDNTFDPIEYLKQLDQKDNW